jgi:hypothetical protein
LLEPGSVRAAAVIAVALLLAAASSPAVAQSAVEAIPRFGLDVGGGSLRARIGIEIDYALVASQTRQSYSGGMSRVSPGLVGLELGAGIAYQW